MESNKLKIQNFRTNDLVNDGGKQFELGKSWCDDFFEFDNTQSNVVVSLKFKAIQKDHELFNDKIIELKLAEVSDRGDRKAYVNSTNGMSQIKDFFINTLHLTLEKNLQDYFAIYKVSESDYYLYFVPSILYNNFLQFFKSTLPTVSITHEKRDLIINAPKALQQIYYGAPGTGKSHTIKNQTAEANKDGHVIRTTFHPDSDYSTFVGCYKPTTIEVPMRDVTGKVIKENDEDVTETHIVYEFVSQAFLEAYVNAWKLYAEAQEGELPQPQYLIIEEINRGNCAQIFGDLFQLLDRNGTGFSDYPIKADNDLKKQLAKAFKGLSIIKKEEINAQYNGKDVVEKVLNGEELLLPNNLYIWATMNTSDQSLFPIDSAFKRRWDWKYVPISNARKNWRIKVNGKQYDWWDFLQKINEKIGEATSSEDKKLGYFFCKADENGIISAEKFVGKVIFYLWNDVFKDFIEEGDNIFKGSDESKPSFNKFYTVGMDDDTMVVEEEISQFMTNLNLHPINDTSKNASDGNGNEDGDDEDNDDEDDDSTNSTDQKKRDKSKFSINQNGEFVKKHVPFEAVSIYVKNHPDSTAQDIVDAWKKLNARVTFVISSDDYETKSKESKDGNFENRYDAINLQNGEKIYVCNQVSFRSINDLMSKVNAQDWGIKIEKIDEQA